MSTFDQDLATRLAAERAAFDSAFASPPPAVAEERVRILTLRVGKDRFALRLSEVAGLHHDRRVVPLTSDAPGLIGMAGIRARVVPVFSLARLLGYDDAGEPLPWLAELQSSEPIAIAFAGFAGHRELPASALRPAGVAEGNAHVREVARLDDGVVPVISVASIAASLISLT